MYFSLSYLRPLYKQKLEKKQCSNFPITHDIPKIHNFSHWLSETSEMVRLNLTCTLPNLMQFSFAWSRASQRTKASYPCGWEELPATCVGPSVTSCGARTSLYICFFHEHIDGTTVCAYIYIYTRTVYLISICMCTYVFVSVSL